MKSDALQMICFNLNRFFLGGGIPDGIAVNFQALDQFCGYTALFIDFTSVEYLM